ncbi:MAG: dihydroxy-acid dehydratase [Chloroflexota bacterium]
MTELRSRRWFAGFSESAVHHRAAVRPVGITIRVDDDRPVIGISGASGEVNGCNAMLPTLAEAAAQGVREAGGIPMSFPTMTLGEDLLKPSAMLHRNLMAMEVEECLRGYPFDGAVLLADCDKTVPAMLMGAASADLPTILLTGGQRRPGMFRGEQVGAGTDLWRYSDQRRQGLLDDAGWLELEGALGCSIGGCNVMGTASTMASVVETLGMQLPGASSLPVDDPRLVELAVESGRRAVALVREDLRPSAILTQDAFDDTIAVLAALGGSTNAVIHLCAIAGRRGLKLPMERFDSIGRGVPVLADVLPSGRHLMHEYDLVGGLPTLMAEIADLLRLDRPGVTGGPMRAHVEAARRTDGRVIRRRADPLMASGGLAAVRGSLAPDGAILKRSAASPALLSHTGPALVFDDYEEMLQRVDDPELPVTADSVLILRGVGPVGVPGMPEWGMIPMPRRLLDQGITDCVRISDGRMSGTSYGTCILHVAPESAVGGPLALVRDGDLVRLDTDAGTLDLLVDPGELAARRAAWTPPPPKHLRGWARHYAEHVLQAPDGCDLDYLVPGSPEALVRVEPIVGRS